MIKDMQSFFNDSRAFASEIQRDHDEIIRYLGVHYSTYLHEEDFEDIYQDACIAMVENYRNGKLKEFSSSVKSYLLSICINNTNKKVNRDHSVKDREPFPTSYDPESPGIDEGQIAKIIGTTEDDCDKEECFNAVRSSVTNMGEKCKQILLSVFWDNLKYQDIADMMDYKSASVVKTKAMRCRNEFGDKFKNLLEICRK